MAIRFVILVLPTLGLANMYVYFHGDYEVYEKYPYMELDMTKSDVGGDEVSIITNPERNTFNLSDNNLKNAINSWFRNWPNNVKLSSAVQGEDPLFGLQQVSRTLRPLHYKVLKVSSEPAVIHNQVLRNDYVVPKALAVNILIDVQNRVSSTWSIGGIFSVGESISYNIRSRFLTRYFYCESSFYYTSSWGKNYELSQNTTLEANVDVILNPGQSAVSQIVVIKHNIQFEVEYEAALSGMITATNGNEYKDTYNKQGTRSFNITDGSDSASWFSNKLISREVINFEFYADSRFNVYDQKNGNVLMQDVYWVKNKTIIKFLN